jgi:lipopolysaccharide/colanic/teichoic acid biosynthesis glycosyltransferase
MSMFVIPDTLLEEKRVGRRKTPVAESRRASWYDTTKVALDFAAALLLLVFTAPLMLLAILLIKITSPGPVIYSQTRLGKNGKPFTIFKLRTMTHNCESLTGAQWSTPGDSRVTAVGRWLRKTHIDELPQLWNVLRGDMSLIGPRPERPEFCPQLEQAIPLYRERLCVRPGVTGFAQVQLPPDTDFDSVRIKLAYDLHYIQTCGFWFDMRVYLGTFLKVIGLSLASIGVLCAFPTRAAVESAYLDRVASK